MIDGLQELISLSIKELYDLESEVKLEVEHSGHGDFSTNVALKLAGKLSKPALGIAEEIVESLKTKDATDVKEFSASAPGFINLVLNDSSLVKMIDEPKPNNYQSQVVVAEYSDPNPFKVLHAGHLYTSIVGDAIANIVAYAGGEVHRVNFGGDVGLHVAKSMWAIIRNLDGENPDKLNDIPENGRAQWLSKRYVDGNSAYENDEVAKEEIVAINKRIYELFEKDDHDSPFARIYWTCRSWSYDYFNNFYSTIGSNFEKYYPESETAPVGLATVREHIPDVYQESQGAIIFEGEKYGLHSRVFINSGGLPTYEAKEVGLFIKKWQDYHFNLSLVITGSDINEYMKVVLKSVEQYMPEQVKDTTHLTHGQVTLSGGKKMSSRAGNIVSAYSVIEAATDAANELHGDTPKRTVLGAIKYAFLKSRLGSNIIYDSKESVSLEGNSGPYLQYAHARARSIAAGLETATVPPEDTVFDEYERELVKKLSEYQMVLVRSIEEFMPHHICTYLYELAQCFNRFYENDRVKDDPRESIRLYLVLKYADRLKQGLELLGIDAPEKM